MKKRFAIVSLIVLMVLSLVAGCTKEPEHAAANGDDEPEAPAVKLVAVGECTFAPFEFVDEETGKPAGFDVDLIQAIAEAANFEVEYKNLDWNSLIAALQTKEADLVVSGMTITDERALEVKFSDPYFESGQAWCVEEDSPIKALDDLSGKTVGVQINTTGDYAAQKLDEKFKEEDKPGLSIKRLERAADVFNELKVGGVDAVISDLPVIQEYLKNNPDSNVIIPEPAFTVEYYGIAMRKQDKDIHGLVNKGLATIKANGKYDELYEKYFGTR
ncbi:MAG TPA: basic amino acid ABC transporter substrate-binding protein [Firmicutes bacterium]|nr:basic amino acid ABC transporter substrate-binding protein [Candidatus Fermentithermobacillaceae bacterium]